MRNSKKCGTRQPNGRLYNCGSPACPYCRDRYIAKQREPLQEWYADVPNDRLGMISVVVGVTEPNCIGQIPMMVKKTRKGLRNLIDRARKKDPAWNEFELTAWAELDVVDDDQVTVLGDRKRRQIDEIRGSSTFSGRIWILTFHGLVYYGESLSITSVRDVFKQHWPLFEQVDVRSLTPHNSAHRNISNIVNYCLKNDCSFTDSDNPEYPWSMDQIKEHYILINESSQGFRSLRFSIKATRPRVSMCRDDKEISEIDVPKVTGRVHDVAAAASNVITLDGHGHIGADRASVSYPDFMMETFGSTYMDVSSYADRRSAANTDIVSLAG